jgi:hypothetical protein
MRTVFPDSESRGTLAREDVPMRSTVVVVDGARVPLVLLRDSAWGAPFPAEAPAEHVLDVYRVDDVQSALLEANRKLGKLDEAMGPIAGSAGLALGFTVLTPDTYARLLVAAGCNVRALRAYCSGQSTRDPRWTS